MKEIMHIPLTQRQRHVPDRLERQRHERLCAAGLGELPVEELHEVDDQLALTGADQRMSVRGDTAASAMWMVLSLRLLLPLAPRHRLVVRPRVHVELGLESLCVLISFL